MSKRFGKKRVPNCECQQSFTCRPCLNAALPAETLQRPAVQREIEADRLWRETRYDYNEEYDS